MRSVYATSVYPKSANPFTLVMVQSGRLPHVSFIFKYFRHISGANYGQDNGSFSSITAALSVNSPPSDEDKKTAEQQLAMITYRLLNAANVLKI